ncbi:MAG: hypothetical protein ACJASQ_000058 [Crocinitomicaceae bacterium]|jgi:hypothetical protein
MKHIFILIFLIFAQLSYSQPNADDIPCQSQFFGSTEQFVDSIEFRIKYWSKIDFEMEMCSWSLAEDYHNTAPIRDSRIVCIVYIEGKDQLNEIEFINLFDNPELRKELIDKIQLIYIYDTQTGYHKEYQKKEEILSLFDLKIRQGLLNQ